jgi:hypothetical protein
VTGTVSLIPQRSLFSDGDFLAQAARRGLMFAVTPASGAWCGHLTGSGNASPPIDERTRFLAVEAHSGAKKTGWIFVVNEPIVDKEAQYLVLFDPECT